MTAFGKVKFELYVCKEGQTGHVSVERRGTRLTDDIGTVADLEHSPWTEGAIEGVVMFKALSPNPATRKGIFPDEKFAEFVKAVKSIEGSVAAKLKLIQKGREQELSRKVFRQLEEAFAAVFEQLPPDYEWFDTQPGGRIRTKGKRDGRVAPSTSATPSSIHDWHS